MLALFAVPVNKPATVALLGLALLGSLCGSDPVGRFGGAFRNPVVRGFLLWWIVVLASALHAGWRGDWRGLAGSGLWVFCYPLIVASVLTTSRWRWHALQSFALAVGLVLLVSYAMQMDLLPQRDLVGDMPSMRNTVFKEYTQQGLSSLILLSMAVSAAAWTSVGWSRVAMAAVALATLIGVTVLLQSRTAYVALVPLAIYWVWRWIRANRRYPPWIAVSIGVAVVLMLTLALLVTPRIEDRLVSSVSSEVQRYCSYGEPTSAGIRLRLWQETLPIIADAPLFGHGFGQWQSLHAARAVEVPGAQPFLLGHPHQEFLLILAEEGLIGLAIFLALVVALSRLIHRLPDPQRGIYASVMLIYLSAGMFNGLWSDFTHRHVFVLLFACIPFADCRGQAGLKVVS